MKVFSIKPPKNIIAPQLIEDEAHMNGWQISRKESDLRKNKWLGKIIETIYLAPDIVQALAAENEIKTD